MEIARSGDGQTGGTADTTMVHSSSETACLACGNGNGLFLHDAYFRFNQQSRRRRRHGKGAAGGLAAPQLVPKAPQRLLDRHRFRLTTRPSITALNRRPELWSLVHVATEVELPTAVIGSDCWLGASR
eukprot:gene24656-biopygen1396